METVLLWLPQSQWSVHPGVKGGINRPFPQNDLDLIIYEPKLFDIPLGSEWLIGRLYWSIVNILVFFISSPLFIYFLWPWNPDWSGGRRHAALFAPWLLCVCASCCLQSCVVTCVSVHCFPDSPAQHWRSVCVSPNAIFQEFIRTQYCCRYNASPWEEG